MPSEREVEAAARAICCPRGCQLSKCVMDGRDEVARDALCAAEGVRKREGERERIGVQTYVDALHAGQKEAASLRALLAEAEEGMEPFAEYAAWVAEHHPGWDHDAFEVGIPDGMFAKT